ncbi:MAG: PIG-L family deacetylase [Desulfobacteraceae bacterium]|jgi:LmbE family N-acetylglucosaminyl deacetylase
MTYALVINTMKKIAKKNLIFSIVFITIATSAYIIKKRCSIYAYDVAKDYKYDFFNTNAIISELYIKNGKILLPKLNHNRQSSFIKINAKTTFWGNYFEPSITLISKKKSYTQYFEKGVNGIRYLNISPLTSLKGTKIQLETKYMAVDNQTATLFLFTNKEIKKAKIMIIAPHPDDAEIAAYGLYSSNKKSYIITITAGDAGSNKYDEIYQDKVKQYLKKGKLRTWNSITVPLLGGIPPEQCINLGFFDATLKKMYKNQSSTIGGIYTKASDISTFRKQNISSISSGLSGKSNWKSLVENIKYLLRIIDPDIIITPYPALDKHKDHKLSSLALFEAIKKINLKKGDLYLYTNHHTLNEHYPYGKMGGLISLPPNFKETIYFDEIYSHTLSIDNMKDKLLALEAMNDLRLDTEWRSFAGAVKLANANFKKTIMDKEKSYYRRAIRSNELFFVVAISNIYNKNILNSIVGEF